MNTLLVILALVTAIFGLCSWIASRPRGHQFRPLANVAEGTYDGSRTFNAESALTTPHLLVTLGAAVGGADICGASDQPMGFAQDSAAQNDGVAVEFLGRGRTKLGVASAAITLGDRLVPAAAGKVRKLPTEPGTYWIIGDAHSTQGTANQLVEILDCAPHQVVVES
jgi:hypothetical protein